MLIEKAKKKARELAPYFVAGAAIGIVLNQRKLRSDLDHLTDAVNSLVQTNTILVDQM